MIFLIPAILGSLIILLTAKLHGYTGAIILGLDAVGMDFLLQWLRMRFLKQAKTGKLLLGILGGMLVRALSIIVFLKLGSWWLGGLQSVHFFVFFLFLVTLPIWSLIGMRKLKAETKD